MTEVHDGAELCFPQLLNSSCRKPSVLWPKAVFLHFVLTPVCVLTVVLNLLVIVAVSHFRQLHSPTNLLLLSLAVSDFLVGFVFIPGEIYRKKSCWFLGDLLCSLYKWMSTASMCASVGNVVLISADRYVAICDPLRYSTRVTVGRARLSIVLCWFCSSLYSSLIANNAEFRTYTYTSCYGTCFIVVNNVGGVFHLALSFFLPVSVIMVLYIRVFVVAVTQARSMRSNVVKLQHSVTVTIGKSELKAARTLGVLVVVFLICFCPYYCYILAGPNLVSLSFGLFVLGLLCLNPCLNPLIYALFYPWFRKAVKVIVRLQILQPGSSGTNVL